DVVGAGGGELRRRGDATLHGEAVTGAGDARQRVVGDGRRRDEAERFAVPLVDLEVGGRRGAQVADVDRAVVGDVGHVGGEGAAGDAGRVERAEVGAADAVEHADVDAARARDE